jgi:probable F420-dependent oxidoreductase
MSRTIAVGLGLQEFPFDGAAGFWRWVDLCEEGGVDSLWQTDRLISREAILECMVTMGALAGRTHRIKFGMNVVSLALRDPVLAAKQCATIDLLSGGRLLPGFGIGSPMAPEWEALNIDTKTRGKRTDEALIILRRLWTETSVDFTGTYWTLKGASISPRPVQSELPIWIGGGSEAAIRRTAQLGTGWQGGPETPAEVAPIIAGIQSAAHEFGRTIDDDHYGAAFPFRFGSVEASGMDRLMDAYRKRTNKDPMNYFVFGDADAIIERLAAYIDAGVSKFILRPLARGDDAMLAQTRRLINEVLPKVAARWPKPAKPAAARLA